MTVDVTVALNQPGRAEWALIDLGVPPGLAIKTEDLAALRERAAERKGSSSRRMTPAG